MLNNVIPIICPKKNSKTETYQKFFQVEDKVFSIHPKLRLYRNGYDKHRNIINYSCYNKECSQQYSHRVWIPLENSKYRKIPSKYFFSVKSYIDNSFRNIYTHRSKIELLYAIWSKSYNLRNTISLINTASL